MALSIQSKTDAIPYREGGFNTSVHTIPGQMHIVVESTTSVYEITQFLDAMGIDVDTGGFWKVRVDNVYEYELINPQFTTDDIARYAADMKADVNFSATEREDLVYAREEELWNS